MNTHRYKGIVSGLLAALLLLSAGCSSDTTAGNDADAAAGALTPKPLAVNDVAPNPYLSSGDAMVHNDAYSSDVTDTVMPLAIDEVVSTTLETKNKQAPPSMFFDNDGNTITPFLGGIAVTDLSGDTITRQATFVPAQDDGGGYSLQISYAFVDNGGRVVAPTSDGRVIMLETKDVDGNVYEKARKVFDVDIVSAAVDALGEDIDQNLLSIIYDYDGNLWFVTGGFRIYPDRNPAGFIGYLSRDYIDAALAGASPALEGNIFFERLAEGEGAENGISANEDGAVILTNLACYMLRADDGVDIVWRTAYESNGANDAEPDSDYSGGGLSWGSGTTPTLTKDLVLFTDNQDPVNLLALSSETGEVVAETPVLDELPDGTPVAVENSILVYSGDVSRTSVIVCNWFGAGNAGLADPDNDSSVQSYEALYDANWIAKGNAYIAPGVERVDIVKDGDSYSAEKVWLRDDVRDTSMIKLSTATGYLYGYWQNLDTGMWCYEILDFDSGETVREIPVSGLASFNNMAVGMSADVGGNTLYCPTNNMEMVLLQDRFVTLPDSPGKSIDPDSMERERLSDDEFQSLSGSNGSLASYLMRASVVNPGDGSTIAFKVNGLEGSADDYQLYIENDDGSLSPYDGEWQLCDENGEAVEGSLNADSLYEIRYLVSGGTDGAVTVSALLVK